MRYSLFIKIVLCCICWQLFIASVFADEKNVLRVEAMGSASVSLTTTQLDNLVVDDAFRRAVAKAVEALVPREELDKIWFEELLKFTEKYGRAQPAIF